LWPRPNKQEIIKWYHNHELESDDGPKGVALFDHFEIKLLEKYDCRKNLSIIDIGCGKGESLKYLSKKGHEVSGIDTSKSVIDLLVRQGFKVYCKTLEEMDDSKVQYDWVICKDVLEHIWEPIQAIKILSQLVKPHGLLEICVPNGDAIKTYAENTYALSVDKEHLHYFRPMQLTKLLESLGFALVSKKFYPKSVGLGRADRPQKTDGPNDVRIKHNPTTFPIPKEKRNDNIRSLLHKLPDRFSIMCAIFRSCAQIVRRCASFDQIANGVAHEFLIIMKKI